MALVIPIGRIRHLNVVVRIVTFSLFVLIYTVAAFGQATCTAGGGTPFVHAEGLAEKIGDITLTCSNTTGAPINSIVFVGIDATITNRLDANGNPGNVTITINNVPDAVTPR